MIWRAAVSIGIVGLLALASESQATPVSLELRTAQHRFALNIDDAYLPRGTSTTLLVIDVCLPEMGACSARTASGEVTPLGLMIVPANGLWYRNGEVTIAKGLVRSVGAVPIAFAPLLSRDEGFYASDGAGCQDAGSGVSCSILIRSKAGTACAEGPPEAVRITDRCRVVSCSAARLNGISAGLCSYWTSHFGLPLSLTFRYADAPRVLLQLAIIDRFLSEHITRQ